MGFTDGVRHTGINILDERTKLLPIYFHSVGHYPRHAHTLRPEGFGLHQMAVCVSGWGVFSVDGKEYDIKIGDAFYFNPKITHEYYPISRDWTLLWVVFDGQNAYDIAKYFKLDEYSVWHAEDEARKRLEVIYEHLYDTYTSKNEYDFSLTQDILEILNIVSKCETVQSKYHNGESDNNKGSFAPVIDFIKKNYATELSLDDLVKKSRLSKNHFTRLFKKEYGVTPMVYLNRYRISVAKYLLTTTIQTVDQITLRAGFHDASYFCAVFRKFEGCSPIQYRDRHKGDNLI